MRQLFSTLVLLSCYHFVIGQDTLSLSTHTTEQKAKFAVFQIVKHSGLIPNFDIIELDDISTAVAYQKGKKRYIGYNAVFLERLRTETGTDWSAISVMAHEIGHHLLGHTLHPPTTFSEELEADKYSGFILFQMGASLPDALAAINEVGHEFDSLFHPSLELRQSAIERGWLDAKAIDEGKEIIYNENEASPVIVSKFNFVNNKENYYVSNENSVIVFNSFGEPVQIGSIDVSKHHSYKSILYFDKEVYYIDTQGGIWNVTLNEMAFRIGKMIEID